MDEAQEISKNKKKADGLQEPGIGELTYHEKAVWLEKIAQELVEIVAEYAPLAGRVAELKAQIMVRREIKSALQSALRAERSDGY